MRVELMLVVVLSNACVPQVAPVIGNRLDAVQCAGSDPCPPGGGGDTLLALTGAGVAVVITSLLVFDRSWWYRR
jgi:hypothetical protein